MRMHLIDWAIVLSLLVFVTGMAVYVKRFTKSVADFLTAGRFAGRYMLTISEGVAGLGAISIIAYFEQHYVAGFSPLWWGWLVTAVNIVLALSGWVIYRYRQTRAMTMAQFFEIRYSKSFRVYTGIIAYFAGVLNFAIFPAVGSRFFIYFCGLPQNITIMGLSFSTFVLVMAFLLLISLFFTLVGGQIAVMVTDFFQGLFTFLAFTIIIVVCMNLVDWGHISEVLLKAPEGASLVNPLDTAKIKDFNYWFYLIMVFGMIYGYKSWQGNSGYNCAAKNPHEARMGGILGTWRTQLLFLLVTMLPICAYTFLNHPDYAEKAQLVQNSITSIENIQIQKQMTVSIVLSHILPRGIMGLFCAIMLAAFISTHDTYLHSWGSMLIQDVILPFRKKPFTQKQHLLLLRLSVVGVAIFVFFFSLLFRQTQYILLYFAITGAIYTGGAGACILGGLYWKKGSAAGAWSAFIIGPMMAVTGLVVRTLFPNFPINEQWMLFITMVTCSASYFIVYFCVNKSFNMDRMLHRGKYASREESTDNAAQNSKGRFDILGMSNEFSRMDRIIYVGTVVWGVGWSLVFLIGTVYGLIFEISSENWLKIWYVYIRVGLIIGVVFTVWFAIGGIKDMRYMFKKLRTSVRNDLDVGMVVKHHNLGEEEPEEIEIDKNNKEVQ